MPKSSNASTKEKLILAAIRLFAKNGINGVSMRTINSAAGAKNASAVHYHFGNKNGIVKAAVDYIRERLELHMLPTLTVLEERLANGETLRVEELYRAITSPYVFLFIDPDIGLDALKFLAQIMVDGDPVHTEAVIEDPNRIHHRWDALLAKAAPGLPTNVRRVRYLMGQLLTVVALSRGADSNSPFGDIRPDTNEDYYQLFLDYLAGGLTGPMTTGAPPSDAKA